MPSYDNDLVLTELATGEGSGTWGDTTNLNLELIGEAFSYGTGATFGSDADQTVTVNQASHLYRRMYIHITSGVSLTATRTLTINPTTISKIMLIRNATTGSQSIIIKQGSGATVTIPNGMTKMVILDGAGSGAAVLDCLDYLSLSSNATIGGISSPISADSTTTFTNKTFDANGTGNSITNIENADISASAAIAFSKMENLTNARALVSDGNGDVSVSDVTSTELSYLDGVTSALQTQLNAKSPLPLGEGSSNAPLPTNNNQSTGLYCTDGIRRFRFNNTASGGRTRIYGEDSGNGAISLIPNDTTKNVNNYGPYFTVHYDGDITGSFGTSTGSGIGANSYNAYVSRAFCNYNGVSNTIRSSRQCTSVTDYGAGNFRFNWDSNAAAAHANHSGQYSWAGSTQGTTNHNPCAISLHRSYTLNNYYTHVQTGATGGSGSYNLGIDRDYTCVITFA